MTQIVFGRLGGAVGGFGEGTEGCHIHKGPSVEGPHIQFLPAAVQDLLCHLCRLIGQVEAGGKIIGAAAGDIAQRWRDRKVHKPGDGLIQGSVPTIADDPVKGGPIFPDEAGGIALGRSLPQGYQIVCLAEQGYGV